MNDGAIPQQPIRLECHQAKKQRLHKESAPHFAQRVKILSMVLALSLAHRFFYWLLNFSQHKLAMLRTTPLNPKRAAMAPALI